MSTKKRFRISNLKLSEVSLVDRPANPRAKVVLFKSDQKESPMSDKTAEQLAAITTERDSLKKSNTDLAAEVANLKSMLEGVNKRLQTVEAEKAEIEKKLPKDDPKVELPKEAKDQIEKALKQAADATEALAKMQDERLTAVFVTKAAAFKNLAQKPETFGPVLKRLSTNSATAEDFQALEAVLKAADAAASTVLKSTGSDQPSTGVAAEKLDGLAKEICKSQKGITYEQAFAKALNDNPDLYTQYIDETQAA